MENVIIFPVNVCALQVLLVHYVPTRVRKELTANNVNRNANAKTTVNAIHKMELVNVQQVCNFIICI